MIKLMLAPLACAARATARTSGLRADSEKRDERTCRTEESSGEELRLRVGEPGHPKAELEEVQR